VVSARLAVVQPSMVSAPQSRILRRCANEGSFCGCGNECKRKEILQRKAAGGGGPELAPPIVHEVLRSPGQPLDARTRSFMEGRFGHNFSRLRVHTDGRAAESARAVAAEAYTVGEDVVFAAGAYEPRSESGKRLLSHELAHVVQATGGGASSAVDGLRVDPADARAEREADAAAGMALRSEGTASEAGGIFSTGEPMLWRKPVFSKDCDEYDRCRVVEPLQAAIQIVNRVLSDLPPVASDSMKAGRIFDLVNIHFHDPDRTAARAASVLSTFVDLKAELEAPLRYVCHPGEKECKTERKGVVGAGTDCAPGGEVRLCPGYFQFGCAEQARQLIHEVGHHLPDMCPDHAYVHEEQYMSLPAEQAGKNPDTYAQFASMVFLGAPSCKECSSEAQLRPGQY